MCCSVVVDACMSGLRRQYDSSLENVDCGHDLAGCKPCVRCGQHVQ